MYHLFYPVALISAATRYQGKQAWIAFMSSSNKSFVYVQDDKWRPIWSIWILNNVILWLQMSWWGSVADCWPWCSASPPSPPPPPSTTTTTITRSHNCSKEVRRGSESGPENHCLYVPGLVAMPWCAQGRLICVCLSVCFKLFYCSMLYLCALRSRFQNS